MIKIVRFPQIDANIVEATITRWLKREGDKLKKGELMLEITTDKGAVEVEAPFSGVLRKITAPENSNVPIGFVMAMIGDAADALPDVSAENREILAKHQESLGKAPKRPAAAAPVPGTAAAPAGAAPGVVRATPAARRLAREKGLDLATVQAATKAEIVTETVIQEYLKSV